MQKASRAATPKVKVTLQILSHSVSKEICSSKLIIWAQVARGYSFLIYFFGILDRWTMQIVTFKLSWCKKTLHAHHGIIHAGVGTFVKPLHQIAGLTPNLGTISACWGIFGLTDSFGRKNGKYFYINICMVYCFPICNPKLLLILSKTPHHAFIVHNFCLTLYSLLFRQISWNLNQAGYLLKIESCSMGTLY